MSERTYGEAGRRDHSPVYRDASQIPLERDLRQRNRTPPSQHQGETQGRAQDYDWSLQGGLAVALGVGALFAWYASRGGSEGQRRWSSDGTDQRRQVPLDETDDLIASNKVEGTAVFDRSGNKIGTVHNFMVGKRSGRVAYAVMSFGGFLGIGGGFHPLPWDALTYDEDRGGYVVGIDSDRLKNAPTHGEHEDPFASPDYGRQVSEYWLIVH